MAININSNHIANSVQASLAKINAAGNTGVSNSSSESSSFQAEMLKAQAQISGLEASVKSATESGDKEALEKVAKEFEEIFLNMLMKSMRSTIEEGGTTEKSNERGIYEGMLDESMVKEMSEAGGIGIQQMMVEQLSKYAKAVKEVEE